MAENKPKEILLKMPESATTCCGQKTSGFSWSTILILVLLAGLWVRIEVVAWRHSSCTCTDVPSQDDVEGALDKNHQRNKRDTAAAQGLETALDERSEVEGGLEFDVAVTIEESRRRRHHHRLDPRIVALIEDRVKSECECKNMKTRHRRDQEERSRRNGNDRRGRRGKGKGKNRRKSKNQRNTTVLPTSRTTPVPSPDPPVTPPPPTPHTRSLSVFHLVGEDVNSEDSLMNVNTNNMFRYWELDRNISDTHLASMNNGQIQINQSGLYLLYGQVVFLNSSPRSGIALKVNNIIKARCIEQGPPRQNNRSETTTSPLDKAVFRTCNPSIPVNLREGDVVTIVSLYNHTWAHFGPTTSFWGLILLNDAAPGFTTTQSPPTTPA